MYRNTIVILKGEAMSIAAMTVLMLVVPMMGLPGMLTGKRRAGFIHLPVSMGWIMHFIIGTILATSYVLVGKSAFLVMVLRREYFFHYSHF